MLLYVCVIYFRRIKSRENRGKVSHVLSVLRRPLNWPNDGVTSQSNATGVKNPNAGTRDRNRFSTNRIPSRLYFLQVKKYARLHFLDTRQDIRCFSASVWHTLDESKVAKIAEGVARFIGITPSTQRN